MANSTNLLALAERLECIEQWDGASKRLSDKEAAAIKEAAAALRELAQQQPVAWKDSMKTVNEDDSVTVEPMILGMPGWESLQDGTNLYAAPIASAEWRAEAERLADEYASERADTAEAEPGSLYYDIKGPEKEAKARAALMAHLDKVTR